MFQRIMDFLLFLVLIPCGCASLVVAIGISRGDMGITNIIVGIFSYFLFAKLVSVLGQLDYTTIPIVNVLIKRSSKFERFR